MIEPPRNAVHQEHRAAVGLDQLADGRGGGGQRLRFQGDEQDVLRRQRRGVIGGGGGFAAEFAPADLERDAAFADGGQLRAARHQRHFTTVCGDQLGGEMAAERTGAKDTDFHGGGPDCD